MGKHNAYKWRKSAEIFVKFKNPTLRTLKKKKAQLYERYNFNIETVAMEYVNHIVKNKLILFMYDEFLLYYICTEYEVGCFLIFMQFFTVHSWNWIVDFSFLLRKMPRYILQSHVLSYII